MTMKVDIKVPAMGESITEATIGPFLKNSGDYVEADEELLELETDKVNQVLYAPQAGVVEWKVKPDEKVTIGQVIGAVDTAQAKKEAPKASPEAKAAPEPKAPAKGKSKQQPAQAAPEPTTAPSEPLLAGNSRITKEAFLFESDRPQKAPAREAAVAAAPAAPRAPQQPAPLPRGETRKKMSKVRRVIAGRLVDVMQQTAMLTTFNEVDMTKIIALRESYKDSFMKQHGVKLGFMSFFVKAVVSALQAHPDVGAYIDGEDLVYRGDYDIGVAVGTDRGLFVPVVRGCDRLSFADIERAIEGYAAKAREGGLSPGDLQGGIFTITNGGTYGSLLSTPILNPPQSAILGMHKIMKRPVVVDDQIVIRQMMYLALSYDHRVVDGKEAVTFLVHIKNALEDPSRLLIGI